MKQNAILKYLLTAAMPVLPLSLAIAAEIEWDGTGSTLNWSEGGNWVGNNAPSTGDQLLFPNNITKTGTSADPLNINLEDIGDPGVFTIDRINFNPPNTSGQYFFGGNTLRIDPADPSDGIYRETTGASSNITFQNDIIFASDSRVRTEHISGSARTLVFQGDIQLDDGVTVILSANNSTSTINFAGNITGEGALRTITAKSLEVFLNANPDWSGGISVIANTRSIWRVHASGALGTGLVRLEARREMELRTAGTDPIVLGNPFNFGIDGANRASGNIHLNASSGADLTLGGATGPITLTTADNGDIHSLRIEGNVTLAGAIGDQGDGIDFRPALGDGTLTLAGDGTYTGATQVGQPGSGNPITVVVNSDISSSSGLTVFEEATLRGTGTVPGILVTDGATVRPGNSVGTLTAQGNVSFEENSLFVIDLGGSPGESSLLDAAGFNLTLDQNVTLNLIGALIGPNYTIAHFDQLLGHGVFDTIQLNGDEQAWLDSGFGIAYGPNSISIIPEPSSLTLVLLLGGLLFAAAVKRRRILAE